MKLTENVLKETKALNLLEKHFKANATNLLEQVMETG